MYIEFRRKLLIVFLVLNTFLILNSQIHMNLEDILVHIYYNEMSHRRNKSSISIRTNNAETKSCIQNRN